MRYPNYQTCLLVLVALLLCISAVVSIKGYNDLDRQNQVRSEYYRLRSGILFTNLRIRDAALTHDHSGLEDELVKITPVRKESLDALEFFRKEQHTFPENQRAITSRILVDRMEYRAIQTKLVNLIRNVDFAEKRPAEFSKIRWSLLQQYNLLMVEYLDKCDALITLSNQETVRIQQRVRSYSIATAGVSILLVAGMIAGRWFYRARKITQWTENNDDSRRQNLIA